MITLITRPRPGEQSAPPEGATRESRQSGRHTAMKAAKKIAAQDPKKLGLRRRDWRAIFK